MCTVWKHMGYVFDQEILVAVWIGLERRDSDKKKGLSERLHYV